MLYIERRPPPDLSTLDVSGYSDTSNATKFLYAIVPERHRSSSFVAVHFYGRLYYIIRFDMRPPSIPPAFKSAVIIVTSASFVLCRIILSAVLHAPVSFSVVLYFFS